MSKFKKQSKSSQEIPTSALPDIIFMLLFFFMVTTVMREREILVEQKMPRATQLQTLKKKSLVAHFYMGAPKDARRYGAETKIQSNDVFIDIEMIPRVVETHRADLTEREAEQITMNLKIDDEVKMGMVNDVQEQFKEVNARKVLYHSIKNTERQ